MVSRAEGPLHRTLKQRRKWAPCRRHAHSEGVWGGPSALASCSGMQTRGFAPGCYNNAPPALCISIGIRSQGPEASLIPAWRNAPGQRRYGGFEG